LGGDLIKLQGQVSWGELKGRLDSANGEGTDFGSEREEIRAGGAQCRLNKRKKL